VQDQLTFLILSTDSNKLSSAQILTETAPSLKYIDY